jgi:hypothetical protein
MPGLAGREQEAAHRRRLADAHRADPRADVVHGVVDRETRGHHAARRVDVHVDVLLRVLGLEEEQLGGDERGHMVLHAAGDEHDPLAQQARIDVERPFAPIRLLDDDGNEAADDVGVIGVCHGKFRSFCPAPINIRPSLRKVQEPTAP